MAVDPARAKSLFLAASDIDEAEQRASYLGRECGGDAELRCRVEALLRANDAAPLPPGEAEGGTSAHEPLTEAHSDPSAHVGSVIAGKYKLLEQIGAGGMGAVWVAEQTQPVRRKVAMKLIKPGMDSKSVLARFEAERQALAVMDHPNIAKVLDGGLTETGRPYFVMEYVKGVPITEYCDATRLSVPDRLSLFVQVCHAVQHAHQKGIIHRDLKPSNILVAPYDDKPVPKVIDFGLAKAMHQSLTERTLHTAHETVLGTPIYMSPEQAQLNNLDVDTRSDIYSLGVLLYELLNGTTPLERKRYKEAAWDEVRRIIREEEPPRPSTRLSSANTLPSLAAGRQTEPARLTKFVRGELDWIVMKALEKDRARRYETANGFAMDVQRFLAGEPVLAVPPSTSYRLRKFVRRNKGRVIAATAVAVALVAGVTAVVVVQARANADLAAKHAELAVEQEKVKARNKELAEEQAKVQARFDMAVKAIATFHTGVSQDALLKNPQFQELRTKLLKEAARFYEDLEKLLAGQTDAKSRKTLAAGYFHLGELTDMIGSPPEALAVHRKALALRRELAAAVGADVETRLDVARSMEKVGRLLRATGEHAAALATHEEQRELAERLEVEDPADVVRSSLASSHNSIGLAYYFMGKMEEALTAWRKALAIRQKLAEANPAVAEFQRALAQSHDNIAIVMIRTARPAEAITAWQKALAIDEKLADANPTNSEFQFGLARDHNHIAVTLSITGKPEQGLASLRKALAILQKLVEANPAVTEFQFFMAMCHGNIGISLLKTGKPEEAIEAHRMHLAINQKLADANPTVPEYQFGLANAHDNLGGQLVRQMRFAEGFTAIDASLAIRQKLTEADPKNTEYATHLGYSHGSRGWALVRSGQPPKAAADLRRALELWAKVPAPDLDTQFERSRTLALLAGLGAKTKAGVMKEEAAAFADQAVVSLRDAISAGWGWPDELKEPDFDAVRGRDDFKKLVAEVQAKAEKAKP